MKNIATNWKTIAPATAVAALLFWGVAGQNKSEGAGSLTPPSGTPTPTMPTLTEISDKVASLGSSGRNFAIQYSSGRVHVWDSRTGIWGPLQTVTGLVEVIESNGNFCARGSSGGAAWNKDTGTWTVVSNIQASSALVTSNGNFCILGSSKATVWNKATGTWITRSSIAGPLRVDKVANGNFLIVGGSRIVTWSQDTGSWQDQTPPAGLVRIIGPES